MCLGKEVLIDFSCVFSRMAWWVVINRVIDHVLIVKAFDYNIDGDLINKL